MIDYRTAKGWLTERERQFLYDRAREVPLVAPNTSEHPIAPCALNVGIEYAASLHCLRAGFDGWIVAIDLNLSKVDGFTFEGEVIDEEEFIYWLQEDSRERVNRIGYNFLTGSRNDCNLSWPTGEEGGAVVGFWTGPIWLAFIDGDHTRAAVVSDAGFANYIPIGGVIAFHDCYDLTLGKPHPHPWNPDGNDGVQEWWEAHKDEWEEGETVDSIRWFRRVA